MKTSVQSQRLPSDRDLNRWIKRVALILVVGAVAFTAFYVIDRWRPASTPIVDQRLAALEEAVRADPSDIAVRGQLADTYVAKRRYQEAITQYTAILETGKAQDLARFGRAGAYLALGQLDAAALDYQAVVEISKGGEMANVDPRLEASYYNLGLIAMKQDKPADAIPLLEKALAIMRSDADALYLIGTAFVATGQTDKAVTVLRASVVFVPIGWSEPYTALADAYTKSGQADLAAWGQAMAQLAAGKLDVAEPALKALAGGEAALDASIGLGLLYESKGDTAAAATWYTKAVAIDPTNNAARMGLSRVAPPGTAAPAPSSSGGTGK